MRRTVIATDEQAKAAPDGAFLRERLATIEAALDGGEYQPGPWSWLVRELRDSPAVTRTQLAPDISRVSRKLHQRQPRLIIGVVSAILLEALGGIVGGILLAAGLARMSTVLALIGTALWIMSFEPLIKLGVGTAFGVIYDYAYLYGGLEPRFKMKYGSYLALAPLPRALLQFAGTVGSPLGALIAASICGSILPTASVIGWVAFWILVLINAGGVVSEVAGVRRLGGMRLPPGSASEMVAELRCWWRNRGMPPS